MLFCDVPGTGGHLAGHNQDILSAIRHAQIMWGHPEPRESSSLPRLRLVQSGVRREHAVSSPTPQAARLPITPLLLRHLRPPSTDPSYDKRLLWATAAVFFWFLSGWRDHGPECVGVRRKNQFVMGRCLH